MEKKRVKFTSEISVKKGRQRENVRPIYIKHFELIFCLGSPLCSLSSPLHLSLKKTQTSVFFLILGQPSTATVDHHCATISSP